jgi:hypothetical protein
VIALAAALGVSPDQIQIPSLEDIVPEQLPIPKNAGIAARGLPIRSVGKFVGKMLGKTVTDAAGYAAGGATVAVLTPVLQDIVNESWTAHPNRPLPAHDAAAAVERGEMTFAEAATEAQKSGYDSSRFNVMEKLAGLAPSTIDLMTMFRRKVIGADLLRKGLVQGNVRTEWADYLTQITETLLPPSDLASAVVQDVMSGSEAEALAEQDGVSASSFSTLVKLAGNPPGAEQLLALWNRKEISSADVDRGALLGVSLAPALADAGLSDVVAETDRPGHTVRAAPRVGLSAFLARQAGGNRLPRSRPRRPTADAGTRRDR